RWPRRVRRGRGATGSGRPRAPRPASPRVTARALRGCVVASLPDSHDYLYREVSKWSRHASVTNELEGADALPRKRVDITSSPPPTARQPIKATCAVVGYGVWPDIAGGPAGVARSLAVQFAQLGVTGPVDHQGAAGDGGGPRVLEPYVHILAGHQRGHQIGEDDLLAVLLPGAADVIAAVIAGDGAVGRQFEVGVLRAGPGTFRRTGRLAATACGEQGQQAGGEQGDHPAAGGHLLVSLLGGASRARELPTIMAQNWPTPRGSVRPGLLTPRPDAR